jgi:hypothetical protein
MPDKSVARRLQMKPNSTVLFINAPKEYEAKIAPLPEGVFVVKKIGGKVDFIQIFVSSNAELEEHVPKIKPMLNAAGLLWVTYRKWMPGVPTKVNRDSIAAFAQIAIDETWSALRLKII